MAEQRESDVETPEPPVLLWPREEAVVDGQSVTFTWQAAGGARGYRLEVAADRSFESVEYRKDVDAGTTAVTVDGTFAPDERTYFWRVLVKGEESWSPGEVIESFISGTADDVVVHASPPYRSAPVGPLAALLSEGSDAVLFLPSRDAGRRRQAGATAASSREEAFGPAGELLRAASAEVAADLTGEEEYYEAEEELGIEHEGIEAKQILSIVVVTVVMLALIVVVLFQATGLQAGYVRSQMANEIDYPELRSVEVQASQKLSQYDVIDAEQGVYRIPIDRAMERVAEEAEQNAATFSSEVQRSPATEAR